MKGLLGFSMEGSDICKEIVQRAVDGFIYSEAVARFDPSLNSVCLLSQCFSNFLLLRTGNLESRRCADLRNKILILKRLKLMGLK